MQRARIVIGTVCGFLCFPLGGCEGIKEGIDYSARGEGTGVQIGGAVYAVAKYYRRLSDEEAARVTREAQRIYDERVRTERARLAAKVERQRAAERARTERKLAAIRRDTDKKTNANPGSAAAVEQAAAVEIKGVKEAEKVAFASIDDEADRRAASSAQSNYSNNMAVLLNPSDGTSHVAFAKIEGGSAVLATMDAYTLDLTRAEIAQARADDKKIAARYGSSEFVLASRSGGVSSTPR